MIARLFAVAVLACVGAAGLSGAPAAEFPEISPPELTAAIAGQTVTILDANGTGSYRTGHLPGAVDFAAHAHQLPAVLPADHRALVVVYCANRYCSHYLAAARAAAALGYTNVRHFAPGIAGWRAAGSPVEH